MSLFYRCPICTLSLSQSANTLSCDNNHQFDFAKEGYINLLPVQFKKSKEPGDNLDMVQARRAFLSQGHYSFLQASLVEMVKSLNPNSLLDMGCGEGFYTQALAHSDAISVYGLDISKPAIRYAAKRYPQCHFAVASCKQTPFHDNSFSAVVSVFAPLFEEECARLLREDGYVIQVSPGPSHLFELKSKIYADVKLHSLPGSTELFEIIEQKTVTQRIFLDLQDTLNLIKMTPFAWKFRPEHLAELENSHTHEVTLDFALTVYKRRAA